MEQIVWKLCQGISKEGSRLEASLGRQIAWWLAEYSTEIQAGGCSRCFTQTVRSRADKTRASHSRVDWWIGRLDRFQQHAVEDRRRLPACKFVLSLDDNNKAITNSVVKTRSSAAIHAARWLHRPIYSLWCSRTCNARHHEWYRSLPRLDPLRWHILELLDASIAKQGWREVIEKLTR